MECNFLYFLLVFTLAALVQIQVNIIPYIVSPSVYLPACQNKTTPSILHAAPIYNGWPLKTASTICYRVGVVLTKVYDGQTHTHTQWLPLAHFKMYWLCKWLQSQRVVHRRLVCTKGGGSFVRKLKMFAVFFLLFSFVNDNIYESLLLMVLGNGFWSFVEIWTDEIYVLWLFEIRF